METHHAVDHQRPLTQREKVSLPTEQLAEAPVAYVREETGEVFTPARKWAGWRLFGLFTRTACYLWCDAPGHLRTSLAALLASVRRRRPAASAPVGAGSAPHDAMGH